MNEPDLQLQAQQGEELHTEQPQDAERKESKTISEINSEHQISEKLEEQDAEDKDSDQQEAHFRKQKWPLEYFDIYCLTHASKQKALQNLQTKLTNEKNQRRTPTSLEDYDRNLSNLNFAEAQIFQEKIKRIRTVFQKTSHKKNKRKKIVKEPNHIRIFKFYVDQIESSAQNPKITQ